MNHLTPRSRMATIAELEGMDVSDVSSTLEEEEFSPAQTLSMHAEEFLKNSVLQHWPPKSLTPDRVAIFFKIGNSMISFSPLELSGVAEEEKESGLKDFCAEAVDRFTIHLSGINLPPDSVVTVYTLFFQHLGPDAAFHGVKGFCSMDNYRTVSYTIAPKLSNSNARTFVEAHYTNKLMTRPQSDLMAFLFPVRALEASGKGLRRSRPLSGVTHL
ncbi:MAG TPA: hypothetical protein VIJ46_03570 [Rhabdochlamydiaceae bacterium]